MSVLLRILLVVSSSCLLLSACGKSQPPAEVPAEAEGDPASAPQPSTESAALSAEECTASGGEVIGDIGDGAIHRPDYVCPSGSKPSGSIRAPEGGPIAIEGSVCCPK